MFTSGRSFLQTTSRFTPHCPHDQKLHEGFLFEARMVRTFLKPEPPRSHSKDLSVTTVSYQHLLERVSRLSCSNLNHYITSLSHFVVFTLFTDDRRKLTFLRSLVYDEHATVGSVSQRWCRLTVGGLYITPSLPDN